LAYFSRSNGIAIRTMLVPTFADLTVYRDFVFRAYRDGRRLLALRPSLW